MLYKVIESLKKIIVFTALCTLHGACLAEEILGENVEGESITLINEENPPQTNWQVKASEILVNALGLTGIKYQYGGNNPQTGFDCSGFVRYVFREAANITLPPTARAISQLGKTVKKDDLQPGDLVFFNTLKSAFSHVGIYIGNNRFVHAPSAGKTVRVEEMNSQYWQSRYNGAQRLESEAE